ncbi:hypothetical protein NE237_001453 [Protea cynaroides]|uniref:50S ribosomal protein L22, chloroplastic n=1 Tax=Protea cynaroides TaxID=273540 RepID=A0A9Q0QYE5_9MAGN|nr:hypothetical protein NE237_001453 [Protea cynaroides]
MTTILTILHLFLGDQFLIITFNTRITIDISDFTSISLNSNRISIWCVVRMSSLSDLFTLSYSGIRFITFSLRSLELLNRIRRCSYEETLMILELMPYRTCYPIFKLIYSARANASHNMGFNKANLEFSTSIGGKTKALSPSPPPSTSRSSGFATSVKGFGILWRLPTSSNLRYFTSHQE